MTRLNSTAIVLLLLPNIAAFALDHWHTGEGESYDYWLQGGCVFE